MKPFAKIALCVFLVSLFVVISGNCFSQRAAEGSSVITKGKNIAHAATPLAKKIYKRTEDRSGVVKGVERAVENSKPFIEKAAPIVQKGFRIGKMILKILKKILR